MEQYPELRDTLNEQCVRVLYEQHLAAIHRARVEKEAEIELQKILERGDAEENGGTAEEQKGTSAMDKVAEVLAQR